MAAEYKRSTKKKLNMEQLQDISLPVSLQLGSKLMRVKELLDLTPGRIVKLDRLAGEVAVIDENFAVRIVTLLSPEERLKLL